MAINLSEQSDRKKRSFRSIRIKIPALMLIMLCGNFLVLFIYTRFYFVEEIALRISRFSGKEISVESLQQTKLLDHLLGFEFIALCLLLILVGFFVYMRYAKPLSMLNESVKQVRFSDLRRTPRADEIGQLQNSFAEMNDRLKREQELQSRMIASISHDIKTPLTSVLGYSETLLNKDLEEERQNRYLKTIREQALQIEQIVSEFDEYLETGITAQLKRKRCPMSYLTQMLTDEYSNERNHFVFTVENRTDSSAAAEFDLSKIRRVFANLIENSVRHNPGKADLNIHVQISKQKDSIAISLSDNGKGIDESQSEQIFEPFFTTDGGRRISGLGLAICANIVQSHGGSIRYEPSDGFCVRMIFPMMKDRR